ncbi:hypothetical protein [Actinacidiphila glaucinigra]|uniref:hypothetical protein n=1 Tax=Actinacidiphila glaucinigra TaxID=235986 RepID=UPI0036E7A522
MTVPAERLMPEVPGTEALWLLEGSTQGRPGGVSVTGPAEVIGDPDETAHCWRTTPGASRGLHDTMLRLNPQQAAGFRLGNRQAH